MFGRARLLEVRFIEKSLKSIFLSCNSCNILSVFCVFFGNEYQMWLEEANSILAYHLSMSFWWNKQQTGIKGKRFISSDRLSVFLYFSSLFLTYLLSSSELLKGSAEPWCQSRQKKYGKWWSCSQKFEQ